ncbi:YHS domain-containing protein [Halomonas sp. GXIMD04776]|uniref:YHS domain-containing protein n=1 Tax=Halomonas sp. GXIMD04776 TaxID=3415605 RepID=UPI003CB64E3D
MKIKRYPLAYWMIHRFCLATSISDEKLRRIDSKGGDVMGELVMYFMLWVGGIFLMMRFGRGAHVMDHERSKAMHGEGASEGQVTTEGLRWVPPADDVDPVCGKTVSTEKAKSSVHDGLVYYFCSRDCRERFEAAPAQYLVIDEDKRLNRNN